MPTVDTTSLIEKFGILLANQGSDQNSNFDALEAAVSGRMVDLLGGRWLVQNRKTKNIYYNGEFVLDGAVDDVGIPERETFRFRAFRLTKTNKYSKWAQDKAHVSPRGVVCVPYLEGDTHEDPNNVLWCTYSYDGGATFGPRECIYRPETTNIPTDLAANPNSIIACQSAGVTIDGRQIFFMLKSETPMLQHYMLHRMMPNYRKWETGAQLFTTPSQGSLQIRQANHGYFDQDVVSFKKLTIDTVNMMTTTCNHMTIAATAITLHRVDADNFTIQATGTAAVSVANQAASVALHTAGGSTKTANVQLTMTAASSTIQIYMPAHNFADLSQVTFTQFNVLDLDLRAMEWNGLKAPNDEYTVSNSTANTFTVTITGTATSDLDAVPASVWVSNEWGLLRVQNISAAIYGAYKALYGIDAADPGFNYLHSFCTDENGSIFTTIQIPPQTMTVTSPPHTVTVDGGVHIVRIDNWRNLVAGSTVFMIALSASGGSHWKSGEGTVKYAGNGTLIGFTRGQDFGTDPTMRSRFWKAVLNTSNHATATITSAVLRASDTLSGRTWDEPTPLIIANDIVYAVRCQRTDDPTKTIPTDRASTKMYLLTAPLSEVLGWADGTHNFRFTEMGRAYWSGAKGAQSGPGVGVGSLVAITPPRDVPNMPDSDNIPNYARVMYFFGCEQENMTGFDEDWNQGQIYGIHIKDTRAPEYAMNNGDSVESGQSDNTQELWYKTASDLQATGGHIGWSLSTGSYANLSGDLAGSTDYVGSGVRLERENNGMVTMFGRLDAAPNAGNPVMVLPHRFRPAHDKQFLIPAGAPNQTSRTAGQALVLTVFGSNNNSSIAGQVYIDRVAGVGLNNTAVSKISLDGIRFPADGDARI